METNKLNKIQMICIHLRMSHSTFSELSYQNGSSILLSLKKHFHILLLSERTCNQLKNDTSINSYTLNGRYEFWKIFFVFNVNCTIISDTLKSRL